MTKSVPLYIYYTSGTFLLIVSGFVPCTVLSDVLILFPLMFLKVFIILFPVLSLILYWFCHWPYTLTGTIYCIVTSAVPGTALCTVLGTVSFTVSVTPTLFCFWHRIYIFFSTVSGSALCNFFCCFPQTAILTFIFILPGIIKLYFCKKLKCLELLEIILLE